MLLLLIERAGWIEPSVYFNDCIARYEGQSFIPVHWTDTKGGLCLHTTLMLHIFIVAHVEQC